MKLGHRTPGTNLLLFGYFSLHKQSLESRVDLLCLGLDLLAGLVAPDLSDRGDQVGDLRQVLGRVAEILELAQRLQSLGNILHGG